MKRQFDWPTFLLFIAVFFGGLVRFMPALATRFPLNDGGMFYTMAQELSANGYILPATTFYNGWNLPFAYPPLGIYLAALLSDLGRIPPLEVFLWLPALLAILAIPAFYLFCRALLADKLRASLATLFFALTPGAYGWHLMGGGMTRALGFLFLLLAALYVLRFFSEQRFLLALPAILFCSLAVLSHPEVGLQTAGLCAVLWLFRGRTRRGIFGAFLILLGVALCTAPWWATIIRVHGFSPLLSALNTGQHTTINWPSLFFSLFGSDEFIPLLLMLRLAGFVYAVWKRDYLLPALILVPAMLDPRSAASLALLSFSMLAAVGYMDFLSLVQKWRGVDMPSLLTYRAGEVILLVLSLVLFAECGLNNFRLINTTLTAEERLTMAWLKENLPASQNFFLLTGRTYSMSDPVQEWFPVLSGHHSQTTLQGLEWILGAAFDDRLNDLAALQACDDFFCVENLSTQMGLSYDYIWLSIPILQTHPEQTARASHLLASLQSSSQFSIVFDERSFSQQIIILERVKK